MKRVNGILFSFLVAFFAGFRVIKSARINQLIMRYLNVLIINYVSFGPRLQTRTRAILFWLKPHLCFINDGLKAVAIEQCSL